MSDILRPADGTQTPKETETPEGLPHSGNLGLEQPVHDFDKTSLPEAVEKGLIETPDDVTALSETPPVEPLPDVSTYTDTRPSRKGLKLGIGVVVVAGLAGAAALFGLSGGDDKDAPRRTATPAAESDEPSPVTGESDEELWARLEAEGDAFIAETNEQSAAMQAAEEEVRNAVPRYILKDGPNDQPTADEVATMYWNIEMGLMRNDLDFFRAALGDEMDPRAPLTATYIEGMEEYAEISRLRDLTPYNFEFGPRQDIPNAIVVDPNDPYVFTVEMIGRIDDRVHYARHRVRVHATANSSSDSLAWNIANIELLEAAHS